MKNWKRFLDDCEILLIKDFMKQDGLLTMLSFVNNDIQFSMELSDNKLPFLEIRLTNPGQKIWMNIYSKLKDSNAMFLTFLTTQKPIL